MYTVQFKLFFVLSFAFAVYFWAITFLLSISAKMRPDSLLALWR